MRVFDYKNEPRKLLTPEIVALIGRIREMKGRQDLYIEADPDILNTLLDVAKIQSTGSSNRIEGIYTSDSRLKELVEEKVEPRNRSEAEIAGYRDVLAIIHESYDYMEMSPNLILQLHRDLYSYSQSSLGGNFKITDNVISETLSDGTQRIRFNPVSAFETRGAIEELCTEFNRALIEGVYDPLLLIPMFILDFLCIHPFHDGNGRMSRLLTLLLTYKAGYIVGKYISVEMLIEKSKETYYEALQDSSYNWHENQNSYASFTGYMLGILSKAYNEFEDRVEHLRYKKLSKAERVEDIIRRSSSPVSKKEILSFAPDISTVTVERALKSLQDKGIIEKVGQGRSTRYMKKR